MKLLILAVLLQVAIYSQSFLTEDHLTGDWGGCRDSLSKAGISLRLNYTADLFSNVRGGINRSSSYLDNFDMILSLDLERLLGLGRTNVFIYGLGNDGENPDADIGDIQGASNIAAPGSWKLYEAWIQTNMISNRLSLLAGLYDLNSEFESLDASGLFINSSHGIGIAFSQTGKMGPSIFPWTSVGLRLKSKISDNIYLQAAALDGVPGDPNDPYGTHIIFKKSDGLLLTFEMGFTTSLNPIKRSSVDGRRIGRFTSTDYKSKFALGFWKYTSEFHKLNAASKSRNNIGAYVIGEKVIYRDSNRKRNLSAFIRLETANAEINRFAYYAGGGLLYTAPFDSRPDDQAGIAFAAAINGSDYKHLMRNNGKNVENGEYNIEMTYYAKILPWFSLQPDIQYIVNPDTNPKIHNSLVLALRTNIEI